jgi:transposase
MGRKSDIPLEARLTAVIAAIKGVESMEVIARRHGITSQTLGRWKQQFMEGGKAGLAGTAAKPSAREKELEREVEQRNQIIGEITVANEILKKSLGSD